MLEHRIPVRTAFVILGLLALLALGYFTYPFRHGPGSQVITLTGGHVDTWWAASGLYRAEYRIQNVDADRATIRLRSANLKVDPRAALVVTGAFVWKWGEQPTPVPIGQDGSIALDKWKLAPGEVATLRLTFQAADPTALQFWRTNHEASPLSSFEVRYRRFFRTWTAKLAIAQPPQGGAAVQTPPANAADNMGGYSSIGLVTGFDFEGLPKIYCCSSAFLGWSEIIAGSELPLKGRIVINPNDPAQRPVQSLRLAFPSGKARSIPVAANGSFNQTVRFDEEGYYRVTRVTGDAPGDNPDSGVSFAVAYRFDTLDTPTVQNVFGPQHQEMQVKKMVAVPQGQPTQLRIRFTDAAGNPVRHRPLMAFAVNPDDEDAKLPVTDANGVAVITFTPRPVREGYDLAPIYPGLVVLSYNTLEVGKDGRLTGLASGPLDGIQENGQWYYPLGEFVTRAFMNSQVDQSGDFLELSSDYGSYRLAMSETTGPTASTGDVLNPDGKVVLHVNLISRANSVWVTLPDLARVFDLIAWGVLTPDGKLLVAAPFIP